jgi:hypothetical protein
VLQDITDGPTTGEPSAVNVMLRVRHGRSLAKEGVTAASSEASYGRLL